MKVQEKYKCIKEYKNQFIVGEIYECFEKKIVFDEIWQLKLKNKNNRSCAVDNGYEDEIYFVLIDEDNNSFYNQIIELSEIYDLTIYFNEKHKVTVDEIKTYITKAAASGNRSVDFVCEANIEEVHMYCIDLGFTCYFENNGLQICW